jgi:hypothetical protein
MKTKVLLFTLCLAGFSFAQDISIYGGLNIAGAKAKDFGTFDISDWQNFGLISEDPSNPEGRVRVNLENQKPGAINIGFLLGANYSLNEKLDALAEINYGLSGLKMTAAYVGINYKVVVKEKFTLGISPRIGYNTGSADLGTISVISGYVPPVILPEGTFNEGDALSMSFSGLGLNIGVRPTYQITDQISFQGHLGYNLAFTSTDGLLCNGVVLPMTSAGVVRPDGSGTKSGLNPSISSSGLSLQLGISYSLGK